MRKARTLSLFFLPALEARVTTAWQPLADVYRAREGWIVKMDLAGVRPQDITIAVRGAQLRISGVRHDWIVDEGWNHYAMEIAYDRFERTIELPCDLEHAGITVECREGMLLLRVAVKKESENV